MISFFILAMIASTVQADGCKGTLKFQQAPADGYFNDNWSLIESGRRHSQTDVKFYANRTAWNVVDCANLCYDEVTYFCNSAIYEPESGECKLSQRALSCLSIKDRRKRHKIAQSGPVLLFCFRCLENDQQLVDEIQQQSSNIDSFNRTGDSNEKTENIPVQMHYEEKELELHQNSFVQRAGFKIFPLRVMTFNTWVGGKNVANGIQKIAKHISSNALDIVALQETDTSSADQILKALGPPWRLCKYSNGDSDYIFTRYPIVEDYEASKKLWNTGCRIQISDRPVKQINVWGVHLDWRDYGPYTACFERSKRQTDELWKNEYKHQGDSTHYGRMNNMLNLLNHPPFAKNMQDVNMAPLIVAGDFNTPSHLDWVDSMKILHCNTSFEWPVSKLLHDSGLKDSYRQVYPDPGLSTGFTWTPIHKMNPDDPERRAPEPQDRIDFIYYRGRFIRAKSSAVYKGFEDTRLYPDHSINDWPSDHASVITEFELLLFQ